MLTVHRRQEHPPVAELPRQRDPPEAPPDEDQDTAEMMVGGGTPGGWPEILFFLGGWQFSGKTTTRRINDNCSRNM